MPDTLGRTLPELDEALDLGDDDLFYVVRSPYNVLTSLRLKYSTLQEKLALAIGSGDVVGPDESIDGNLAIFSGETGKLLADSGQNIAGLLNRNNHVGTQPWTTISDTPTTLEGYGILDAAAKIAVQDDGSDVEADLRTLNFIGFSVTTLDGAVTIEAVAGSSGAPSAAKYIVQEADAGLSGAQALSDLGTGLLKNTTGTGVLSIASPGTDYLGVPGGAIQGDILVRGISDWGRLPKGDEGMFFRAGPSDVGWAYPDPAGAITLTDSATIAVDALEFWPGRIGVVTITSNRTLGNPSNAIDGQELSFRVRQDSTGGYSLTLDTNYRFSDIVPSLTVNPAPDGETYIRTRYNATDDKFDVLEVVIPA